jgi:hypothetical protein
LILGTRESTEILTKLEYDWYKEDDPHTAGIYLARAVLPYLLVANVRAANASYRTFTSDLSSENKGLAVQDVSSQSSDLRVFPSLPLINFLGLLLLAVQKGSPDVFRQLRNHYAHHLDEVDTWDEALEMIGEMYFGIQRPRQANPLMDMMGSLFGGGGGGAPHGNASRRPAPRRVEAPAAEGLD